MEEGHIRAMFLLSFLEVRCGCELLLKCAENDIESGILYSILFTKEEVTEEVLMALRMSSLGRNPISRSNFLAQMYLPPTNFGESLIY